ncbi:Retrovirus-related Pol polyprotein from transposon RE1 [Vitis vinifera]|uniref:Retrovirus-related Pol polyprotein from transposon RE1 n=2 Tax=Vitis vinifera TaxID=29760 RepID=A0A438D848_VITVI|nr:Retrovirus-related Pol polyprotein from transposon RE1 [Vitis vinifera]
MVSEPREKKNPNYFRFIRESILGNLSVTVFHSGHLSHLLKLTDQPYRRQKTLTVGDFSSDLFPAKSFSDTDYTIRCTRRRSSSFLKAPKGDSQPRTGHACFFSSGLNLTRWRVRARGAFSGHALPPPSSPDAAYKTCFKFWNQAKGLYTNDIQRLYKVTSSIVNVRQQDMDLSTYIGQIASLKEEFLTVMPLTTYVGDQRTQIDKFFMVLTLIGLRPDLETVRDQILGSSSVPSLDDVFARLLRISSTQTLPSDNTSDSSVLVSQTNSRGGRSGNRGKGQCPHCTYCNKLGHTRDRCYQLHGRPPRTAHVAQSSDPQSPQPLNSSTSQGISLTDSEYDDYLLYQASKSASVAFVAETGNASACLTHTSSLGPWILDSGASDHISSNKDLFSSITTTSVLPTVTLANGSQTMAKGFGFAHPLPSLPLHSDQSTGKTIGIGRESQGLYHLTSPSTPAVCISTDAPSSSIVAWATLVYPSSRKCDNAREYFSAPFTSFMSQHGIIHQSSCAHTPQQNGVVESCYLINRMPSSVLHAQIPHSLLFPDQPLYFLPPRVFGCTCFVHILTPGQNKLSTRATKCIFLGYSRFQKGYRCYSSETLRYFLSVDVTFFEDSPFFSTSKSLPVSEVLPLPIISPPDAVPSRPLHVYHRRHRVAVHPSLAEVSADSLPIPSSSPAPALPPFIDLPIALRKVGCRWVYTVKVDPDGQVDHLKARLVAKGYTQIYGSDYGDTFSCCQDSLYIKNVFLHGDLAEEVYMEQPPGFVVQGESGLEFGMFRSSDQNGIQKLKQHLFTHFQTKDLGKLKYFLGIEIAQSSSGVVLSQRKYALDILEETGMLDCKPVDTPYESKCQTYTRTGGAFRRSGEISATCSHWDAVIRILRYIKSTPGQGVLYENKGNTQVVGYIDADWASSPTDRCSTSGYCVFIGGNLISWKSKKQDVVARSSVEAEYRAMALATCELIWLKHLLRELRFGKDEQMKLICDNQATLHIASNPIFHEITKHIEVDCHFIREKIASRCVVTSFVNSNDQLADIFIKSLRGPRIKYICNKLGAYNIYAPT